MSTLGEIFSQEAGQRRRAWLDAQAERALDAAQYYLGPGVPVRAYADVANALNPVADLQQMSQATTRAMQPGRTGGERLGDILDAGTSAASFLAPGVGAAVAQRMAASRGGSLADDVGRGANALADTLTGMSAAPERALRDFIADDAGAIGRGAETPAQEVARFLREGRASEVTNDMYSRADPLELHDLYIRGATGADMPMDEASRMARARDMGAKTDFLHATAASDGDAFDAFEGDIVWLSEANREGQRHATNFAEMMGRRRGGGVVYPVRVLGGESRQDFPTLVSELAENVGLSPEEVKSMTGMDAQRFYFGDQSMMTPLTQGVEIFENYPDAPDGILHQINLGLSDPRNIRSRFARFDPRLSHLSHLSAGLAGGGVTLGALTQQPPQQDPRREIAEYLQSIR
jgi:hypothetical protein